MWSRSSWPPLTHAISPIHRCVALLRGDLRLAGLHPHPSTTTATSFETIRTLASSTLPPKTSFGQIQQLSTARFQSQSTVSHQASIQHPRPRRTRTQKQTKGGSPLLQCKLKFQTKHKETFRAWWLVAQVQTGNSRNEKDNESELGTKELKTLCAVEFSWQVRQLTSVRFDEMSLFRGLRRGR